MDVEEAPESAVGADRDVVRNAKEATTDRRILAQRNAKQRINTKRPYMVQNGNKKSGENDRGAGAREYIEIQKCRCRRSTTLLSPR